MEAFPSMCSETRKEGVCIMMQKAFHDLRRSAKQGKDLRVLLIAAMFVALNLAIDQFSLQITPELKLSVGFVTGAMTGFLCGPSIAMLAGAITDVLAWMIRPVGPFFLGFTLTAALAGLIYGLVLYRCKFTFGRALLAKALINLICNIGLTTLWVSMLGGKAFFVLLPLRALKNLLLLPIEAFLLYLLGRGLETILTRGKIKL